VPLYVVMATTLTSPTEGAPGAARPVPGSAVLVSGCDGYPAGTIGRVVGRRQGCVVFAPSDHSRVARWTHPRRTLLVPPSLLVVDE
jgi:hypothetical protein